MIPGSSPGVTGGFPVEPAGTVDGVGASAASPTANTLTVEQIAEAFREPVRRSGVSIFYRLGLLVVAVAMTLLPLVYVAIIGCVSYGVFWHATENTEILQTETTARGKVAVALIYAAPIVAGAILILFMIKPLFARRAVVLHSQPVDRNEEPSLYAFVEALCKAVRAPVPRKIEVNCEVNAAAGFSGGVTSLFGRNLTLTIGLPLAAGLTLRQVAGVLAHEFGHFSQGAAMRLSYIIRAINGWFARVVYERDVWDARLEAWSKQIDIRVGIVLYLTRFFVWLTRRILWLLMVIGHGISCFMMRQMEYDADGYEYRVAGSETFEETSRRMRLLAVAHQAVHHDLHESWQERRLADDLPTLVAEKVHELPEEIVKKIEEVQDKERTGLFDTHPTDRARIRRARKRAEPGVFTLEAPATALFSNYPERARLASMFHYAELVGGQVRPEHLVSTAALIQERRQKEEEEKRLVEYLGRVFSPYRPLEFPEVPLQPPEDPQASVKALRQAYQGMFRLAPAALRASREFHEAYQKVINARRARVILEAGFKIDAKTFGLGKPNAGAAAHAESEASHAIAEVKPTLDAYAETARTRLLSALQLLLLPQAQERLKDQVPVPAELQKLHDSLIRLTWGISFVKDLQREMLTLAILLANLPGNQENAELFKKIQRGISACHQQLKTIHASYQSEPYPFEHSQGRITVSQYLLGQSPVPDQGPAVLPKCEQALDNFFTLYFRVIGRLAYHASILERAMGFPEKPIPEPEDSKVEGAEAMGAAG